MYTGQDMFQALCMWVINSITVFALPFVLVCSNSIAHVQYGSHVFIPNKNMRIYLYKEQFFIVQSTEITVIKFLSRNHSYVECEAVTELNGEKMYIASIDMWQVKTIFYHDINEEILIK